MIRASVTRIGLSTRGLLFDSTLQLRRPWAAIQDQPRGSIKGSIKASALTDQSGLFPGLRSRFWFLPLFGQFSQSTPSLALQCRGLQTLNRLGQQALCLPPQLVAQAHHARQILPTRVLRLGLLGGFYTSQPLPGIGCTNVCRTGLHGLHHAGQLIRSPIRLLRLQRGPQRL